MADKVLLFVDESESFITKSIIRNLEAKDHKCAMTRLRVDEISKLSNDVEGYVFYYVADLANVDQKALVYLQDMCLDKCYKLYYMGYEDDIKQLNTGRLPQSMWGEFHRPINAAALAENIDSMLCVEPTGRTKHILVVDDSGVMLNTIKEWLDEDYFVTPVNSATNALLYLAENQPDLILLDYEMPICNGPQLLEMIRQNPKLVDIPVIFLTGKDDAESVKKVLTLHPQGYLLKSRPKNEIKKAINDFFAKEK